MNNYKNYETQMITTLFQSNKQHEKLEFAIQQAQTREAQIIDMSQWMTEVNALLQNHLEADILAGDIQKEYEVCTIVCD
jgi:plasmid maintenance system killer protein